MKLRSNSGRVAVALAFSVALASLLHGGEAEDELKCATLLAFVQNAHWSEQLPAGSPLTVGVFGRPALVRCLRSSVEGKIVEGHPLRVLELHPPVDPNCCQVAYVATDKVPDLKTLLQPLSTAHVLTLGESEHFLELGGAVNLHLVDGHMAFEVSMGALDRSGVAISSRLLRFGQIRDLAKGRSAN